MLFKLFFSLLFAIRIKRSDVKVSNWAHIKVYGEKSKERPQ